MLSSKITPISFFNDGTWGIQSGNGSITSDTVNFIKESGLKVIPQADQTETIISKNLSSILNLNEKFVILKVFLNNPTSLLELRLRLYTNNTTSKYYEIAYNKFTILEGWNTLIMKKEDLTPVNGATDWAQVTKLLIKVTSLTGLTPVEATFGALYSSTDLNKKAKIIFTFDDSVLTAYTVSKPMLDQYGFKGVFFVITNVTGTRPYYVNLEQLHEMYDEGWDICSHTLDHADLTTLDLPELRKELIESHDYIVENGFTRSSDIFATPGGNSNIQVNTEIKKVYSMHRGVRGPSANNNGGETIPLVNPYFLKVFYCGRDYATLTTAKARVDKVVAQKDVSIFVLHDQQSGTTPTTADNWLASDFNALVDYIATYVEAGSLEVITLSELRDMRWVSGIYSEGTNSEGTHSDGIHSLNGEYQSDIDPINP